MPLDSLLLCNCFHNIKSFLAVALARNTISRCRKSYPGATVTPKYSSHGLVKKPNTAVARVPPIRSEMAASPVSPINNEKTFLMTETSVN